jgi:hypothetical protein
VQRHKKPKKVNGVVSSEICGEEGNTTSCIFDVGIDGKDISKKNAQVWKLYKKCAIWNKRCN